MSVTSAKSVKSVTSGKSAKSVKSVMSVTSAKSVKSVTSAKSAKSVKSVKSVASADVVSVSDPASKISNEKDVADLEPQVKSARAEESSKEEATEEKEDADNAEKPASTETDKENSKKKKKKKEASDEDCPEYAAPPQEAFGIPPYRKRASTSEKAKEILTKKNEEADSKETPDAFDSETFVRANASMDDLSEAKRKAVVVQTARSEPSAASGRAPEPVKPVNQFQDSAAILFCGACLDHMTLGVFSSSDEKE
jgi:hypothetical protein